MKTNKTLSILFSSLFLLTLAMSCKTEPTGPSEAHLQMESAQNELAANLDMYEKTWDLIINKGEIDQINESNFDQNITLVTSPENVVGIEGFKAYYQNYLTGFSNVEFTIVDVFGQGDKIVKHWNFKGTHSGEFFGIPATDKDVDIDGVTLVKMKDGKIAQEQDFMDNYVFLMQLGLIPEE